jgi:hypothetical protein
VDEDRNVALPYAGGESAADWELFTMWRSFFWSIGAFACLLGAECLVVEKAVLHQSDSASPRNGRVQAVSSKKEVELPDWAPWSLFSFGAITLIYSVTIPKRAGTA